ncbi:hypothetical protein [Methylobacterium sp. 77]|uniref:hypothetical protein n=1 Tax=Methylobacterium sp. 77 TaxID=1101192 RepID=UPI0003A91903|nr:hypothetical protein [Methylobacterium sp. 77]
MIQSKAVASGVPELAILGDDARLAARLSSMGADPAVASGGKSVDRAFGSVVVSSPKA